MIQYYQIPKKNASISTSETLTITEEYQLKDSIYNKSILNIKSLNMKNSNINDKTISLLWTISEPLSFIIINLSENFSFITDAAIQHIIDCSNIKNLKELHLADNTISDEGILKLTKAPNTMKLEVLVLYGNSDITSESLIYLAQSEYIKNLKRIDLHDTSICDKGLNYFFNSPNCQSLTHVDISMNSKKVTDYTLKTIAFSETCKSLLSLKVEDCFVTDDGFGFLTESENVEKLEYLNLNNSINKKNNVITDISMQNLAFSKFMKKLKTLELRNTDVTSKGINSLSISINVENLEILRLSYCMGVKDDAQRYLESIADYRSLNKLFVNSTLISREVSEKIGSKYPNLSVIY